METVDFSSYIVCCKFIIGVLIALSSEKLGTYAGIVGRGRRESVQRLTRLSVLTFGHSAAILSAFIYLAFHILKIGS